MTISEINKPNYIFETSWEVCNKVGGIHTVVSTKAVTITNVLQDRYIVLGPDLNNENNLEFDENPSLLKALKLALYNKGVRVRIGRWKVKGSPIAILVDFSTFIPQKDKIFKFLWETYKVDSISGGWDYIEPVLFGYAASKVIECYVDTYCCDDDKIIAHFHEWMTASGGLCLNKSMTNISTVFTTHATVAGRSIAGNGLELYKYLDKYNADEIAHKFNVVPKHSIEKAAAHNYDCFATVSELTANECKYLLAKEPDIVTPNGFENSFVPQPAEIAVKRAEARKLLINLASALLGREFDSNTLIVGSSGRYEFRNKGLDLFIDSLAMLNNDTTINGNILAYIMVPGWNLGSRINKEHYAASGEFVGEDYPIPNSSHYMGDLEHDQVVARLRDCGLIGSGNKVSVVFIPAYISEDDGLFNLPYYDILTGFDLTMFPSYYEPWGYTPLESIAFGIPTVTTSLAGFGLWAKDKKVHTGVDVITRSDDTSDTTQKLAELVKHYTNYSKSEYSDISLKSQQLSNEALWSSLIVHYYNAYDIAINKKDKTMGVIFNNGGEVHEQVDYLKHQLSTNSPTWSRVIIERSIPQSLEKLEKLSHNLWWCWNADAIQLFESIDPKKWQDLECNPIALIDNLNSDRLRELTEDTKFIAELDKVYKKFSDYMALKVDRTGDEIAYFCMEYGLHCSLKIYSGGLGILAGDYLKESSDQNIPMSAVGLLYRYGYFTQKLSLNGEQEASYESQNFYKLPIFPARDKDDHWISITINYPGRTVTARVWKCEVGRTDLYLLDVDHDLNQHDDRCITHHLYGGDWENRLKQEILLGIGGIKVLEALNIKADVYHCNEGHAAFTGIQRINNLIKSGNMSFSEALEVVRSSSLFTTHTPVPAGHDAFPEDMMRQYMSSFPDKLKINWEQFINLGRVNHNGYNEKFSMSFLACNLSQEVNGVSWLHGEISKEILGGMWPGYFKNELHIGYVTNGVHFPTWTAPKIQDIYNKFIGKEFNTGNCPISLWSKVNSIPDEELWAVRLHLKTRLINHILDRVKNPSKHRLGTPQEIVQIQETLKPDVLTIGFARRFATYKRAHLLFTDLERLAHIVNNPNQPVQFVFAGKAHPNDKPGQDLINRIVQVSSMPQFVGKIIFLQNYDMELAKYLVQGVDVWMNTPTRPLEASGTSGEKCVMNGVLHFSVLDGWWVEGYKEDAGWMLPMERTYADQHSQDQLDAEMIYTIIEEEIAPDYYARKTGGVSSHWMSHVKKSISEVASNFTTKRMIEDYQERFYSKLAACHKEVSSDNYKIAREIAAWKRYVGGLWNDNVSIVKASTYDIDSDIIITGKKYQSEVIVDLGALTVDDIGVELVIAKQVVQGASVELDRVVALELEKVEENLAYYKVDMCPDLAGSFDVAVRVYAHNKYLKYRMDFALVKWS